MECSLPVEPTQQPHLENTQNRDVDETSRKCYVDHSERNFTDLFNISDYTNNAEDQHSSCSDIVSHTKSNESESSEVHPKRKEKRK